MGSNVIEIHGRCNAERCKRDERLIANEADLVVVRGKSYHKGCEPTQEQLDAMNRGGD